MGASGIHLIVIGATEDTIIHKGVDTFRVNFVVEEDLLDSVILGSDFLITNKITLDFGRMALNTGTYTLPFVTRKMRKDTILIQVGDVYIRVYPI